MTLAEAGVTGQWGTLTFDIPDMLADTRDAVNSIFEVVQVALELANLALEFAKTFLVAFIDPLSALLNALMAEIQAFIQDLKQVGLYLTGDWALLEWPMNDLKGGYQAYERRMIARMSDRSDPTRPDVSSKSLVFGMFTYLSVDASGFEQLVNFIQGLLRLFGLSFKSPNPFPTPIIRDVFYGTPAAITGGVPEYPSSDTASSSDVEISFGVVGDIASVMAESNGTPPGLARVTWTTQPVGGKNPFNPIPAVGPKGFIVTVSTFPDPIPLHFARPKADTDKKEDPSGDATQQPREYGVVRDSTGSPVLLYGGAGMLDIAGSMFEYNDGFSNNLLRDNYCQVFGRLDPNSNECIPLESLKDGDTYFFQRHFVVNTFTTWTQWASSEYSIVLDHKDMPHRGKLITNSDGTVSIEDLGQADTYYVRVAATSEAVATSEVAPRWSFTNQVAMPNAYTSGKPFIISMDGGTMSLGPFSQSRKVTFPTVHTAEYLKALQTAMVVMVLSRSDYPHVDELLATKGAEAVAAYQAGTAHPLGVVNQRTGLEPTKVLINRLFPSKADLESIGGDPLAFRNLLFSRTQSLALEIYDKTGPQLDLERMVVEGTPHLRGVGTGAEQTTWLDLLSPYGAFGMDRYRSTLGFPILDGVDPSSSMGQLANFGVAANPYSIGIPAENVDSLFYIQDAIQGRTPSFFEWADPLDDVPVWTTTTAAETQLLLQQSTPFMANLYRKFIKPDGTLQVSSDFVPLVEELQKRRRTQGSCDNSPVFYMDAGGMTDFFSTGNEEAWMFRGMVYCRDMFLKYQGGVLYQESLLALNVASSVLTRSPQDGEWIAIRLLDSFPDLDNFLVTIENWLKSLKAAVESVTESIRKYIEFVQGAIADLQQLIQRINALIQSFLSFLFILPSFSGLLLSSAGTDALLADFVNAKNKPQDSPLSYGAGVAVVAVSPAAFFIDTIFLAAGDGGISVPPNAVGTEETPPALVAVPVVDPL